MLPDQRAHGSKKILPLMELREAAEQWDEKVSGAGSHLLLPAPSLPRQRLEGSDLRREEKK